MKFNTEDLDDLLWGDSDTLTKVEDKLYGKHRWSVTNRMIFTDGEKFYEVMHEEPATECQEVDRWKDADSNLEIECHEVRPVQVTVTKYVRV